MFVVCAFGINKCFEFEFIISISYFIGSLSSKTATQLGAVAIRNAVERSKLDKSCVQEVYMGCVVQAGVGQAPATQAALFAGRLN
jgi:acetyl-CoA C-acetyltransferase